MRSRASTSCAISMTWSCELVCSCRLSNNFSRLTYKFSRVFEPLKTENRPVPTHIFSVQQAAPFSHNQGCANSPFHNEAKMYESAHIPHPFPWGSEGFSRSALKHAWTGHRE